MATNSGVDWTHNTANLWWGCTKCSRGCKHCYAETWSKRYDGGLTMWGPKGIRDPKKGVWNDFKKWQRAAEKAGTKTLVFTQSMSDLFEGPESCTPEAFQIMSECRDRFFTQVIPNSPNLIFQLLTKRPENIMKMVPSSWKPHAWPENVWTGTSVEDQKTADIRVPILMTIPSALRFLSVEPLVSEVSLTRIAVEDREDAGDSYSSGIDALNGIKWACSTQGEIGEEFGYPIGWVIVGGESGPGAEPMHPQWARTLRDECIDNAVPFFFKQWGAWAPAPWKPERAEGMTNEEYREFAEATGATHSIRAGDGFVRAASQRPWSLERTTLGDEKAGWETVGIKNVGKKAAGFVLEGHTYREFPKGFGL